MKNMFTQRALLHQNQKLRFLMEHGSFSGEDERERWLERGGEGGAS